MVKYSIGDRMDEIIEKRKINIKKILKYIISFVIIIILILLYSRFIATTGLKVKEYNIINNKITDSFDGLKVIHLSDIHYGRTVNENEINKVVNKINFIRPDIVVITGDLLDRDTKLNEKQIKTLTKALNHINTKYGKYAITGNHDYKHDEWESIMENSGFINLNDTYDVICNEKYENILISGMSTNTYNKIDLKDKLSKTNEYLSNTNDNIIYQILIMHEPDFLTKFDYSNYDLVLAGHSHNGQVRLPFIGAIILPPNAKEYYNEYYNLGNTKLYISSGLGTSNIDFRLFNRPSINFYRITNK